ncbi:MAG TPA: hypothetical protein VF680_17215 [Allosphingosinicella sp.]|jgi:hypothetical protein
MFGEDPELQNCFYILHEFSFKNPDFTAYEHKLTNNPLFVKHIDLDNKVIYIFRFPEEYLNEYAYLYNSQYSKFGEDAKQLILDFWGQVYSGNTLGIPFLQKVKDILYKSPKLKEKIEKELSSKEHKVVLDVNQELGEYVEQEYETFKIEEFVKSKV